VWPPPVDDLVARAKSGDEAAWRDLYEANAGRLLLWLRSRPSGDAAVAFDDVAAEAWLTAAQRMADFSGNSSDFAGWLFGIARNIVLNTARRSARRATYPAPMDGLGGGDPAANPDAFTGVDGADWTRRLLAHLPPREAEVVACIDVVGLDVAATSQALGITAAAVRVSHSRGLRHLRKFLVPVPEPCLRRLSTDGLGLPGKGRSPTERR
jgi:RNA polymerase sigma-70 factor, ECF subfamily